jgi:hypothetical protein
MRAMKPDTSTVQEYITRDVKVPIYEGDDEFNYGWRCIPVQPPPRADDELWGEREIDRSKDSDRKTYWRRVRRVAVAYH